jgi:isocitrate dehydrogenase
MAGALMLDHLVATEMEHDHSYGADAIRLAVNQFLADGWVTADLARSDTPPEKILGTRETGTKIIEYLTT